MNESIQAEENSAFVPKIILADDTELSGSAGLNETNDDLWVWPDEVMGIAEAVVIFDNPEKTRKMTVSYAPGDLRVFEGYTQITTVQKNAIGKVSVRLRKPL